MRVMALTGGIATGKSSWVSFLEEVCPGAVVFDCDESVAGLLEKKETVDWAVERYGEEVRGVDGKLDRGVMRRVVFSDEGRRREWEGFLHPQVREECLELLRESGRRGASPLFVADVPLLFESGFDFGQELSLVVAVSRETQVKRLKARDGFGDDLITAILSAQLPIGEKVDRGDVVFWNEGPPEMLRAQLVRFLEFLDIK